MADRPDIDALLISALYGELTPAEETRLAAHLESHPADRGVLDALTQARDAVRESRFLQLQFEPPQAVSALLLQEAARRAPKAAPEEREGWFARFVRSFAAHPAMAAAAMLVIVVGVATIATRRSGDQFAKTTVSTTATERAQGLSEGGAPAATVPPADYTGDNGVAAGSAAATEEYKVDLYSNLDGEKNKKEEVALDTGRQSARPESKQQAPDTKPADQLAMRDRVVGTKGGVELRKPSPMPKDLDAPRETRKTESENRFADAPGYGADKADGTVARVDSVGGEGAAGGSVAPAAPPPPTVSSPSTATATSGAAADPNLAWAQRQHQSVLAQARAGNCTNAANLAVTLSARAHSYYTQNVANDRELKGCRPYIAEAVTRETELRAQRERAKRAEGSKRAIEQPAKPATTDSK